MEDEVIVLGQVPRPTTYELVLKYLRWAAVRLGLGRIRIYNVPGLRNASAELCGRVVQIDIEWLVKLRRLYGSAAVAFVVFHEAGHLTDCNLFDDWDRELFADRIAGQLLRQRGLPFSPAASFIASELYCVFCATHPPAWRRLSEARLGYRVGELLPYGFDDVVVV